METRIRQFRAERGWTVRRLAQESGVDKNTISEAERGRRNPNPITMHKLAGALGVNVEDLFQKAQAPLPLEAFTVGGEPVPTFGLEDLPAEARAQLAERGYSDAYFVPLEEGEEEDKVELRFYQVNLLGDDAPILRTVRKASGRLVMAAELPGLKAARIGRGVTFGELVALSGLTAAEVADLESGEPLAEAVPVAPLADALGVPVSELLFPADQVAAFLSEDKADSERIRLEMEKLDANDLRALMLATPALRKIREGLREGQEARGRERSEAC